MLVALNVVVGELDDVATLIDVYPHDPSLHATQLWYIALPTNGGETKISKDDITPERFFMSRVGQSAAIAMLYEKPDSLRDIFVKTLRMDGSNDGRVGSDIGANFCQPGRIKIVCDRSAESVDAFAVLWTELNNTVHEDDGTRSATDNMGGMLNASRVHLSNSALHITAPITLGSDQDGLVITDFDGVLDDARIRVVYSLADPETGGALLMTNEKYFHNSFESDVTYTQEALVAHDLLPVNVTVRNTGTSAIESVTATINGEPFTIDESYVAPMRQRSFIVNYPIGDNFDGYISSSVSVVFDNVFAAKAHPRRRAMSYLRQVQAKPATRISGMEQIKMELISQSIEDGKNIFVVALTDESMRGLDDNHFVNVGLYPHPSIMEPLGNDAVALIAARDFIDIGGKRKAFATLTFDGVKEPTEAYLTTHIIDGKVAAGGLLSSTDDESVEAAYVGNATNFDNTYSVNLYPTADPAALRQLLADDPVDHRIKVAAEEGGVRLSGLNAGEHLRLFNAGGMAIYSGKAPASDLFIPVKTHGVYLLSGDKEVFKFQF